MISLEKMRKIEPKLADKSDEELADIRDRLYEMAQLAYERYVDNKKEK